MQCSYKKSFEKELCPNMTFDVTYVNAQTDPNLVKKKEKSLKSFPSQLEGRRLFHAEHNKLLR